MDWICHEGHHFRTCLAHIIHKQSWCETCYFESLKKEKEFFGKSLIEEIRDFTKGSISSAAEKLKGSLSKKNIFFSTDET
jgi:uncharacterized FlgJ-related protein